MSEGSLSQEEINALFSQAATKQELSVGDFLTSMEEDALGEIGNISLGSSTTALSTLLNQRVEITTPTLSVIEQDRIEDIVAERNVSVHVDYTVGIRGKNLLMIKENDAKIIASLMMGGDGTVIPEEEISELHLSAVQEAMNQMMGSAATSMSTMLHQKVDISPPSIGVLDYPPDKMEDLDDDIIIKISFRLKVGSLIDSNMIQLIPLSFAKEMIQQVLNAGSSPEPDPEMEVAAAIETPVRPAVDVSPTPAPTPTPAQSSSSRPLEQSASQQPIVENANVQKVEYATFAEPTPRPATEGLRNIDVLYDIPLDITVELGRTEMKIRKILELGPGAVIQLDKLAGEPVDILANHKLIAKGEVVVIEESFGVRITDIINPADRLNKVTM